jgi:hypothetical protein
LNYNKVAVKKCVKLIDDEDLILFFEWFWSTADYDLQNYILCGLIEKSYRNFLRRKIIIFGNITLIYMATE